ncbi:MAG: tRNA (adenosine(37)-N6)-threonylcarbamoyltransferase complex dimerization subunit type 1 TsaB [Gemmatimonadetes bacterium]|nr:tRNA (adenosine(37)-N6)-threonylcarbamoyltransferase complex dimerization subunit type 1 TsaB [Gemmatimonadota bacterium]MBT8477317.1 tRNA (adenosine(37)-N6)-threonylcarbamoyltransferase complex dimerization subunit type 1 TsaB [Gemmatimonadota bacterium]NNK49483.1 tRNA (adenosine(37)-N6)-threonylcarbamoyltransferase complex dimerization subunit type 1 TsaB [Gemmatimonadota bacterium]
MIRLALDTSTPIGSVAVGRGDEVLAESLITVRATHSEAVLPEIDRLLTVCGLTASDLQGVVVGGGPGSFTGVRIAAALAKGLCHARGLDLYSFSSLAAVAAGTRCTEPVCAMFDARRGQVYAAGYRVGTGLEELFAPRADSLEQVLAGLDPSGWFFAGDGAGAGEESIRSAGGRVLDSELWVPRAGSLLWLASVDPDRGRVEDPGRWEPEYVRLPAAQREQGG